MGGRGITHTLTHTQDMREKEECVSGCREGRRRKEACLFAHSECSDIEKLVGSQRK